MKSYFVLVVFMVLLSGVASGCPVACPLIYAPVCLDNGVTAGNECAAKCENATIKCMGECPCKDQPIEQPLGCPMTCPTNWAPVCLENGVTSGNECAAKCEKSPIKCKGECPCKKDGLGSKSLDEDVPYQCFGDPDPGPCRAFFQRYAFNYTSGKCEQFVYGGCQGNSNNFYTMEECNNVCVEPKPTWRCQPECIGLPVPCSTNLICANATCNPVYGFLEAKPLVLDVNSWQYGPGGNHQPAVPNAQACCNKCRATDKCNVWSFCANPDGCGSGCMRPSGPNQTDQSLTLGPFGNCKPNGAFFQGTCRLGMAVDLNVTEVIVPNTNWTSGVIEDKFDLEDGVRMSNLSSLSV